MRDILDAAGIATAALDARLLLQHALQAGHEYLVAHPDAELDVRQREVVQASLARRMAHEPVSRIIGEREFYGGKFVIGPDVLDPRPDTETLVEAALEAAGLTVPDGARRRLLDIGTGSGAIAVSLLNELPDWRAVASDVSGAALEIARRNIRAHGLADRLELVHTSWLDGLEGKFDLIVSNPPYIATPELADLDADVRDFDPVAALDGGEDGLQAYRAIVPAAYAVLKPGGFLCVEIGAGQESQVWHLFAAAGFSQHPQRPARSNDLAGHVRVISGWKP